MVNLIDNGSFVGHIGHWIRTQDLQEADYSASESASVGSGSIEFNIPSGTTALRYRPSGEWTVPLQGLTSLDLVFKAKTAGVWDASIQVAFYDTAHGISTPLTPAVSLDVVGVDAAWTQYENRDEAVPVGATHAHIFLYLSLTSGTDPLFIDDIYVGTPDGDNAPYAGASPLPQTLPENRMPNPDFEIDDLGWAYIQGDEILTWDDVDPIAGVGSLKVVTFEGYGGQGTTSSAGYDNRGLVVIPSESLRISFKAKTLVPMTLIVEGDYYGVDDAILWSGPIGVGVTEVVTNVVIPAAAFLLIPKFLTEEENEDAVTFWIDDVFVGYIGGGSSALPMTALMVGRR